LAYFLESGQHESSGFAGAGLGGGHDIVASEYFGYCSSLNRGRGFISRIVDSPDDWLVQIECSKRHVSSLKTKSKKRKRIRTHLVQAAKDKNFTTFENPGRR
jgi:hypothetical protein